MLLRVVLPVVHAEDERDVRIRRRSRDDDLLCAGLEVLLCIRTLREQTGRLDRDVHAEVCPRKVRGVALGEELDLVLTHADRSVARLDRQVERSEHRVVLEQVRHRVRVPHIVRGHDLEVALLELGAKEVAADAAEAVDPDPDLRHH
jgi:hypothetical protein